MKPSDERGGNAAALSAERWAQLRKIVEEALKLAGPARSAFISEKCGPDEVLRSQVEKLTAACERADDSWEFLAHPAGELIAPLLADTTVMVDPAAQAAGPPAAFCAALADRYVLGPEIGRGGMATVYLADDVRHQRRVALKVLEPRLGALLGADRFLAEIRVTASLQHPNLVPLFDSGEAGGLLYYVMPLIEGTTLRARLQRERQLPVAEAVNIIRTIAGALDYAHRQGVVHRDLKPENILLHDGQPLVADFGISLAVSNAADARSPGSGKSLGTPQYMSPEQATPESVVDARSDIYSLACVLYELLVGDPPFKGNSVQAVIAKVLKELPARVSTLRPAVPAHVDAAIARALSKLPSERYGTAREFSDALVSPPSAVRANAVWWRNPAGLALVAAGSLVTAVWMTSGRPGAATESTVIPYRNLIDQKLHSAVTITPDGRALVYTGSTEAGRPIMMWRLNERAAHAISGTEGGHAPFVSPDGRRLAYISSDGNFKTIAIDGAASSGGREAWRYGNGAWVGNNATVTEGARVLVRRGPGGDSLTVLTRLDSVAGEYLHRAPLLIPGTRAVVFTVVTRGGPGPVMGQLALASLDPGTQSVAPHVLLRVRARRAIAFVDGWLLYTRIDGTAIMAVRLDVERQRISEPSISVWQDEAGDLESASLADNGTLLYVRRPRANSPLLVDSSGTTHRLLADAEGSFMYPRISPDGKRFAVQVSSGTDTDVWLYDIASPTPRRLTTTGKALHPTWTPDGQRIVFMTSQRRELMSLRVDGNAAAEKIPGTENAFAPTMAPDGRSVLFQRSGMIWSAPLSGDSLPHKVLEDPIPNTMAAVSPDGRFLAYVSTKPTGRNEVYARAFAGPGQAVQISDAGGAEPVWSTDGQRVNYAVNGALMAVDLTIPSLAVTRRRQLFKGNFDDGMPHRNYDITPDGNGFIMIEQSVARTPEAVVMLNWLTRLRKQLASERLP